MVRNQNFPDKIKIVFNRNNVGFIALDDKSVETGKIWAGGYNMEPEMKEYDNGMFTLKLSRAARNSYQSGKVSFWVLIATAPDGRSFEIGINSESLNTTLLESTLINGEIQGNFYLGRTTGQQSISKKDGVYYKEYLSLIDVKNNAPTKNYNVGDIILYKLKKYVYFGEVLRHIKLSTSGKIYRQRTARLFMEQMSDKERNQIYFYGELEDKPRKNDILSLFIFDEEIKYKGRVVGKIEEQDIKKYIQMNVEYLEEKLQKAIDYDNKDANYVEQKSILQTSTAGYHFGSSFDYYAQKYIDLLGIKTTEELASHFSSKGLIIPFQL